MMAEGRSREAWHHTSNLLAMLINSNPFREGKTANATDFNPFHIQKESMPLRISFRDWTEAMSNSNKK